VNQSYRVFISHSYVDRELAGSIKAEIESYGVKSFVAHDDISATEEWLDVILQVLRQCDVFIALLTNQFQESDWTDQETGIAVALQKKIIAIKIDTDPYGFISKYQALKWRLEEPDTSLADLVKTLTDQKVISRENLIDGFRNSRSWEEAARRANTLSKLAPFAKQEIDTIFAAAAENYEIYQSFAAKPFLNALFNTHESLIDPNVRQKWLAR